MYENKVPKILFKTSFQGYINTNCLDTLLIHKNNLNKSKQRKSIIFID